MPCVSTQHLSYTFPIKMSKKLSQKRQYSYGKRRTRTTYSDSLEDVRKRKMDFAIGVTLVKTCHDMSSDLGSHFAIVKIPRTYT